MSATKEALYEELEKLNEEMDQEYWRTHPTINIELNEQQARWLLGFFETEDMGTYSKTSQKIVEQLKTKLLNAT